MVLVFLARFVKEANIQQISEAQAFLDLPAFLGGLAKMEYDAGVEQLAPEEGGVSSWPEAVNYLLRSYAQNNHISDAINDLRATQQKPNETEREFATRVHKAVSRCGNVHSPEEIVTMYIDGLSPTIRSIVAREHESRKRPSMLDMTGFAASIGDAQRVLLRRQTTTVTKPAPGRTSSVNLLETISSSTSAMEPHAEAAITGDALHVLQEGPTTLATD